MDRFWSVALTLAFVALLLLLSSTGAIARDFGVMWLAGKAIAPEVVYSQAELTAFAKQFNPEARLVTFVYPPFVLFVAAPLSLLPVKIAYFVWNAAGAILFVHAARPYLPHCVPALLPLALPASLTCLAFGQYGLIYGALWLYAFRGIGWAAALLTFKPHLGLLAAPRYLADARSLILPALVFVGLVTSSAAIFGLDAWVGFFRQVFGSQTSLLANETLPGWKVIGVAPLYGYNVWGWAAFAVCATHLLVRDFNVWTAATATFLISPYGFHYDMTVASLGFVLALLRKPPPWQFAFLALALLAPLLVRQVGTWFMPPILLAALWALVGNSPTEPSSPATVRGS